LQSGRFFRVQPANSWWRSNVDSCIGIPDTPTAKLHRGLSLTKVCTDCLASFRSRARTSVLRELVIYEHNL
jgi:hypothetical protein